MTPAFDLAPLRVAQLASPADFFLAMVVGRNQRYRDMCCGASTFQRVLDGLSKLAAAVKIDYVPAKPVNEQSEAFWSVVAGQAYEQRTLAMETTIAEDHAAWLKSLEPKPAPKPKPAPIELGLVELARHVTTEDYFVVQVMLDRPAMRLACTDPANLVKVMDPYLEGQLHDDDKPWGSQSPEFWAALARASYKHNALNVDPRGSTKRAFPGWQASPAKSRLEELALANHLTVERFYAACIAADLGGYRKLTERWSTFKRLHDDSCWVTKEVRAAYVHGQEQQSASYWKAVGNHFRSNGEQDQLQIVADWTAWKVRVRDIYALDEAFSISMGCCNRVGGCKCVKKPAVTSHTVILKVDWAELPTGSRTHALEYHSIPSSDVDELTRRLNALQRQLPAAIKTWGSSDFWRSMNFTGPKTSSSHGQLLLHLAEEEARCIVESACRAEDGPASHIYMLISGPPEAWTLYEGVPAEAVAAIRAHEAKLADPAKFRILASSARVAEIHEYVQQDASGVQKRHRLGLGVLSSGYHELKSRLVEEARDYAGICSVLISGPAGSDTIYEGVPGGAIGALWAHQAKIADPAKFNLTTISADTQTIVPHSSAAKIASYGELKSRLAEEALLKSRLAEEALLKSRLAEEALGLPAQ